MADVERPGVFHRSRPIGGVLPTSPGPRGGRSEARNAALDGWRCVACLLVFFVHKAVWLDCPPLVANGSTGVHMFFVLSGYLLFSPFLAAIMEGHPSPPWRRYYLRRFLRIYPPYLLSLVLFLAARSMLGDKLPDATNLITHFFLIFNYFYINYFFSINAVYWSLAIEAQFYLILPVIGWAMARSCPGRSDAAVRAGLAILLAIGVSTRAAEVSVRAPDATGQIIHTTILSYTDLFAVGMTVSYLERRWSGWFRECRSRRIMAIVAGLALYLAANNWHSSCGPPSHAGPGFWLAVGFPIVLCAGLGAILLAICCAPPSEPSLLRLPPVVWVGTISYSLFLYHIGVQVAVQRVFPLHSIRDGRWLNIAQALLSLPPTIVLSALMYYLVERPCLRTMARLKGRSSPSVDRAGAP
jgi:peptidoglycan/LPS O-acetylase OafA/YrhL